MYADALKTLRNEGLDACFHDDDQTVLEVERMCWCNQTPLSRGVRTASMI
jgi:hypothetical protein